MPYKTHEILLEYLDSPSNPGEATPVLDLACGAGRSGLMLAQRDIPVVFADRSTTALDSIRQHLSDNKLPGSTVHIAVHKDRITIVIAYCVEIPRSNKLKIR